MARGKKKTFGPDIRDPRPPSFGADANEAIERHEYPCRVSDGGGGLACYASRDITAGETILVERPLVLTVSHSARSHTCAMCLADSRKAGLDEWSTKCSVCSTHCYCSEPCARAAAPRHGGLECEALCRLDLEVVEEDDRDAVLQAIRILADRANGTLVDIGPAGIHGPSAYAQRLVGLTPTTASARDSLERIVAAALAALPQPAHVPPATLLDLLERHSCNLYGVSGRDGAEVAAASFVGHFHLLNHSCAPNVVFDSARPVEPAQLCEGGEDASTGARPPTFALRALEDVPHGGELCISYTSSADGPSQRREHLEEWYGFVCTCVRCSCDDPCAELDFGDRMDAKRCAVDGCGSGLGVPACVGDREWLRCVHCGDEFEAE